MYACFDKVVCSCTEYQQRHKTIDKQTASKSIAIQTPSKLSAGTPRKISLRCRLNIRRILNFRMTCQRNKLKTKYKQLKKQLKRKMHKNINVKDILSATENLLSGEAHSFFATQIILAKRRSNGRRYSNAMKNLSLSLYYRGPRAHNFLSGIFALLSKSSLHLWSQNLYQQACQMTSGPSLRCALAV